MRETVLDLSESIDVIVDPAASPVDLDEALAEFLIQFHRSTLDASPGERSQFVAG
jgi:hypothetical protein